MIGALAVFVAAVLFGAGIGLGISFGRELRDAELADKNHDRGGEEW